MLRLQPETKPQGCGTIVTCRLRQGSPQIARDMEESRFMITMAFKRARRLVTCDAASPHILP